MQGTKSKNQCWVCGSRNLKLVKTSNIKGQLSSENFAISDSNYGVTLDIYRCLTCGFLQASVPEDTASFYKDVRDHPYETGRASRSIQARKLLKKLKKYKPRGRLLDVGAGSGMLVEQAIKAGYETEGLEPSEWLVNKAREHNLPLYLGTLPHPDIKGPYDAVLLIDLIEHVPQPLDLLKNVRSITASDGIVMAVTPDLNSLAARILGWKWWHFRVAHAGYFNSATLRLIFDKAGFEIIEISRPTWYLSLDYLITRFNKYLPGSINLPVWSFFKDVTLPVNLRDSLLGIFKIKGKK